MVLDPDLRIPPLYMFDTLHTRKHIANRYVRGRIEALKEKMEELAGKEITPEDLLGSIEIYNENRTLLKKVADLRRADPPRVSGVEALQIIGSSFFMAKEEHNKLLKEFLADADAFSPKHGVRVYLSGTIVDNTQLYELIESCGATIVSEDICTGDRYSDNLVDTSLEPLDALTDRYYTKSHEGRMHPLSALVDYVSDAVTESKAEGVIFNYLQWDDSHGWNYPSQRDALKEMEVPSLAFDMQEYKLSGQEQLRTRVEAFVEMIREQK
jgi:benzoyl-CoA reductase/2-hydroxyglutaryl-CoA dehydratase subunit BcrC/BadD/HgdB